MPMFHMEHCVFCAFLSTGTDYTICGRPCDKHEVKLRDRVGAEHPLKADAGCRNTVFNSQAQTGAEYVARMLALGARHFRIEFLNPGLRQPSGRHRLLIHRSKSCADVTNTPTERSPVDLTDVSPTSSQAIGSWAGPLSTIEPEAIPEDVDVIVIRRHATLITLLRNPFFDIGAVLILTVSLLALLAPLIQGYGPLTIDINALNQNPSPAHFMGTDYLGRDMWSRLIWGGRTSLPAAGTVVVVSLSIGVVWGIFAGLGSRIIDEILMRLVDIILAFPGLVLAYTIIAFMGSGTSSVVVALGIAGIPGYARVARGSTLSAKTTEYVQASIAQGQDRSTS